MKSHRSIFEKKKKREFEQKHLVLPFTKAESKWKLVKQIPSTMMLFHRGGVFSDVSRWYQGLCSPPIELWKPEFDYVRTPSCQVGVNNKNKKFFPVFFQISRLKQ